MSTNLSLQGILKTILHTEEENTHNQAAIKKNERGNTETQNRNKNKNLRKHKKATSINIQLTVITLGIYELNSLNDTNQINGQRN